MHPISWDVAAIFDPFGNAVHTALTFPMLGEDVLVTGAGPIGILAAMVSRHAGARHVVITDLSDERLALARSLGVSKAVNVDRGSGWPTRSVSWTCTRASTWGWRCRAARPRSAT